LSYIWYDIHVQKEGEGGGLRGVQKSYFRKLLNLFNSGVQRSQETKYTTMRIQGMDDLVGNPGINKIYDFKGVLSLTGACHIKYVFTNSCSASIQVVQPPTVLLISNFMWLKFEPLFMYMKFKDTIIMLFGPSRLPPLLPFI